MTIKDSMDVWAALNADSGMLNRLSESIENDVLESLEESKASGGDRDVRFLAACMHLEPTLLTAKVCNTLAGLSGMVAGVTSYGEENWEFLQKTKASLLLLSLDAHSPLETLSKLYALLRAVPDVPRMDDRTSDGLGVLTRVPSLATLFETLVSARTEDRDAAKLFEESAHEDGERARWDVLTKLLTVHRRMLDATHSVIKLQLKLCLTPTNSRDQQAQAQSDSIPIHAFMDCTFQLAQVSYVLHAFASGAIFGPYP